MRRGPSERGAVKPALGGAEIGPASLTRVVVYKPIAVQVATSAGEDACMHPCSALAGTCMQRPLEPPFVISGALHD